MSENNTQYGFDTLAVHGGQAARSGDGIAGRADLSNDLVRVPGRRPRGQRSSPCKSPAISIPAL